MKRMCAAVVLACAASAAALSAQSGPAVGRYYIYDVGPITGDLTMFKLNQSGTMLWNSNGRALVYKSCWSRAIGSLAGGATVGRDINNNGVVVGKSRLSDGRWRAFMYNGTMHDLGGGSSSNLIWEEATGVTFWGDVSGIESVQGTLAPTAVRYSGGVATAMARFQTPQGLAIVNTVDDVNDSGDVVGTVRSGGGSIAVRSTNSGYLWQQVKGVPGLESATFPFAMNMYGHVTGAAGQGFFVRAFISKDPAVPATDLGTLGGTLSTGLGINSYGWVVGWAEATNGGGPRAFVHDGTSMHDLNSQLWNQGGWLLREAMAVNDAGQIVGEGMLNGALHAFYLQPMARPPLVDPCARIIVGGVLTRAD